ncbi:hypothetical protein WJX72_002379 [[Myrmecia] bisecta]|uniref:Uncharacterized protein n=1 Tax=[Myrmecia] bisecta TaxID=41462 RepID=A0AAW1R4V6_9CHLO
MPVLNIQLWKTPSPSRTSSRSKLLADALRRQEEYVELDDEGEWDDEADSSAGALPAVFKQAWSTVLGLTEKLTDIALDFVPDTIPRTVVDTAIKGGLFLILLGFARSILSFGLTIGTIVLGLYIATRVMNADDTSGRGPRSKGKRGPDGGLLVHRCTSPG